jgi:aldehyde:ferredoxin oxidoreductase
MDINRSYKRVLYIDFDNYEYEFKIHEDLYKYLGGLGLSYKLFLDYIDLDPVILATGPLSGFFPYVSKASMLYTSNGRMIERFGGGTIGPKMNFLGLDAIVFHGKLAQPTLINIFQKEITFDRLSSDVSDTKTFDFGINKFGAFSQDYFNFGEISDIDEKIGNDIKLNIESTESFEMVDFYGYEKLYSEIIADYKKLTVEPRNNPSCTGCPMGCDKSHQGEDDENVAILPRCLISCAYAEQIYKEIPFVYSCLSSLGLNYKHEDLEIIPELIGQIKVKINEILNSQLETK